MCWPDFDSPSVFCRLLDKDIGGYFSIAPQDPSSCTTKQQYLPSSAILQTRYIHEDGVVDLVDFFPRPKKSNIVYTGYRHNAYRQSKSVPEELKEWLVRRVACVHIEVFPAFDYAREPHTTTLLQPERRAGDSESKTVTFHSKREKLQLDVVVDSHDDQLSGDLVVIFEKAQLARMKGEGVHATVTLREGQGISLILRRDVPDHVTKVITTQTVDSQQHDTQMYWSHWLGKANYKGGWREVVSRSLMILKMLTYEPTGAIVAAATFSIPEAIGGTRNWDYRFSWIRDSSFTIYILLRMGFTEEADAYMEFVNTIFQKSVNAGQGLRVMYTIRGETEMPEEELDHLDGYKGSKPVRIGNGAAFHQQLDIYGELMDGIYLYNKYGKPISWDTWVSIRRMLDYVLDLVNEPDMSIWEVRNNKQNFVYSKVMLWVAFDRGLRLADKRCLPCPNRQKWLTARDTLHEEIMEKGSRLRSPDQTCLFTNRPAGYNKEMHSFIQSYESTTVLDSSILIAPLVFFISPNDPRFLSTMDRILLPPDKGGLTSAGLVHRYDVELSDDGVGGHEGAFSMCTFWLVEAMTRAGVYERDYLVRAINLFENILSFSNHLSMFSEEIARSGEQLGNSPQAFSHLALISAAFNMDRAMNSKRE
ncbi:hypothetical protein DL765_004638 [Monosporascus sp. GIB2]|nr:hypothetical protein DL765_004638 [Monosporascus sp. GIB2]